MKSNNTPCSISTTANVSFADILDRLVFPVSEVQFREDIWQKKPAYFRRQDPAWFHHILPPLTIEELVRRVASGSPANLKLLGRPVLHALGDDGAGLRSSARELAEGAAGNVSLMIQAVQKFWPELHELVRDLEQYFTFPVNANLYYSPRGGSAYAPHYDRHDALVLQLFGSKEWQIGEEVEKSPLEAPHELPFERSISSALRRSAQLPVPPNALDQGGACLEGCLRAGDALYIPRGVLHWARATEECSLHVTLGISAITWADVLHTALRRMCADTDGLRASLPIGFAVTALNLEDAAPIPHFTEAGLRAGLAEVARHYGAVAQSSGFRIAPVVAEEIYQCTVVERRPGVVCTCWRQNAESVRLAFLDQELQEPNDMADCCRFLIAMKRFRVEDCPFPGDDRAKLLWMQRLIGAGLLSPVRLP